MTVNSSALRMLISQIGALNALLRSEFDAGFLARFGRWKETTVLLLRRELNDKEADKFALIATEFDSSSDVAFDGMLESHLWFLVALENAVRAHPEDYSPESQPSLLTLVDVERALLERVADANLRGNYPALDHIELPDHLRRFAFENLRHRDLLNGVEAASATGLHWVRLTLRPAGWEKLRTLSGDPVKEMTSTLGTKVFISHRATDRRVAQALIRLLRDSLGLTASAIRCTSVTGSRLAAGAHTSTTLREDILAADVFIGLISEESWKSIYVLFEIGARWGTQKPLLPVLLRGVSPSILTGPLAELNALALSDAGQVHQLVQEVAALLSVRPVRPTEYQESLNDILAVGNEVDDS